MQVVFLFFCSLNPQFWVFCCACFGIYRCLSEHLGPPACMPSVADSKVVPVLCTATVLVCYFLVLPNSCWRFLRCFVGTMAEDDDNNPNQLWCICRWPAGKDKFMICCDCCHEWYHGECVGISVSQEDVLFRDNENYVCPLCLQSSNN